MKNEDKNKIKLNIDSPKPRNIEFVDSFKTIFDIKELIESVNEPNSIFSKEFKPPVDGSEIIEKKVFVTIIARDITTEALVRDDIVHHMKDASVEEALKLLTIIDNYYILATKHGYRQTVGAEIDALNIDFYIDIAVCPKEEPCVEDLLGSITRYRSDTPLIKRNGPNTEPLVLRIQCRYVKDNHSIIYDRIAHTCNNVGELIRILDGYDMFRNNEIETASIPVFTDTRDGLIANSDIIIRLDDCYEWYHRSEL